MAVRDTHALTSGSMKSSINAGDAWGGLAAMFVALPSSIAFGIAVYTTLGADQTGRGALAGLLGAAALGIIASFFARNGAMISAPCAPAAAVLSALIVGLTAKASFGITPDSIPALIILTVFIAACLQLCFGFMGWGSVIKFIPFPVVSGYMSGVGILIALSQLPKLLGLARGIPLVEGLLHPAQWGLNALLIGSVTIAVTIYAPRLVKKVPSTILGLASGIGTYFLLAIYSPHLLDPANNSLIVGPISTDSSILDSLTRSVGILGRISFSSLAVILIPAITLSILLSIDTLKTCVVLDTITISRHNSDRVLKGVGLGNLCASLVGGIPGGGTMGPTLVNSISGGRSPRSGVLEGVLVLLVFFLLKPLIAWVPISALAGILLVIAIRMFDWDMFKLLKLPASRLDFCVILGVIVLAVTFDLIAATGAGVGFAILLFIRDQVKGSIIYHKQYLGQISSKTHRNQAERAALAAQGNEAVFCELQGNLFFGTADQMFVQLEKDLRSRKFILFDMRRVQSVDYTAMHLLKQMQLLLSRRDGTLLYCSLSSNLCKDHIFERYLQQIGISDPESGAGIFETRDSALEWLEERILREAGIKHAADEPPLELSQFDLFASLDPDSVEALAGSLRKVTIPGGQTIFRRGDSGDELFLVRKGSVKLLLPLESGAVHHLANIGRSNFFGELAFLDKGLRSAEAETKEPTDLYILSRAEFDRVFESNPGFALQVVSRLALVISERLRQADTELLVSKER